MKANYYYKGTGQPVGHITIKANVTSEVIEKMIWYLSDMDGISLDKLSLWNPKQIERRIRDRFTYYGIQTFDDETFDPFDDQASFLVERIREIAKAKFPDFYNNVNINEKDHG